MSLTTVVTGSVPRFESASDYAACSAGFAAAGYTATNITRRLGVDTVPTVGTANHPLFRWRTRGGDPLDTFIRLFLMALPVPAAAAREALRPVELETWLGAGLLAGGDDAAGGDGEVRAAVRLVPYAGLLVANDLNPTSESEVRADYVMGVGAATITLANATVRRKVGATLDLGSGCGTLAMLAAAHSDRVVALDRNTRAVEFARFNADLNAVGNIEHVAGSLFEPLAGRTFDLIVTNPPFVISPESRYLFRDSGMRGDEICRTIVRQAPQHLAEGGLCQMLCNWAHLRGEDWKQSLSSWFEGSGCDAWVVRSETQDAATYADVWLRQTEKHQLEKSPRVFEEWMGYYDRNGIEAVSAGLINLRKSTGRRNWVRIEDAPPKMVGPVGEDVARGFETRTFLEAADDAAMLNAPLRADAHVRLEHQFAPGEGQEGWRMVESILYRAEGFAHRGRADPYVAGLLAACTGDKPLRDVIEKFAGEIGRAPAEITPAILTVARQLAEQGFLAPPAAGELRP